MKTIDGIDNKSVAEFERIEAAAAGTGDSMVITYVAAFKKIFATPSSQYTLSIFTEAIHARMEALYADPARFHSSRAIMDLDVIIGASVQRMFGLTHVQSPVVDEARSLLAKQLFDGIGVFSKAP